MIKPRPENTGMLALDKIRIDGGTQMRAELNEDVVAEYAQTIRDGADFPAVVVFFDGSRHWLADGFHRFHSYRAAGAVELPADVRPGTKRDAILHSVGANASHGLRRSSADKRKAVETLLADKEWSSWPQTKIAEACGVSQPFVSRLAAEAASYAENKMRMVERGGATYQQNTANIGKGRPTAEAAPAAPARQDGADRAEEMAERHARQAEIDHQSEVHRAALPESIRQAEAVRDAAIAHRRETYTEASGDDGLTDEQRIADLREAVAVLEAENAALKDENAKFEAMRVQWEQGGFANVMAGKDEEIRVLQSNVEVESADKVEWMKKAKFRQKELDRLGWKPDVVTIDGKTGARKDG